MRRSLITCGLLATALIAAACGSGDSPRPAGQASASSSSPASTTTTTEPIHGEASANQLFPVAAGDQWVFRSATLEVTLDVGVVTKADDGNVAKLRVGVVDEVNKGGFSSTMPVHLYSDGRVGFPYAAIFATSASVGVAEPGEIVLPPAAAMTSAASVPSSSRFRASVHAGNIEYALQTTVHGGPAQSVTEPAGTYDATPVAIDVTETADVGAPTTGKVTLWLAQGVGIVRIETTGTESPDPVFDLMSTKKAT